MSRYSFPTVEHAPKAPQDVYLWTQKAHLTLWNASRGKINAVTDEVTLTPNADSTVLLDSRLAGLSYIGEMPLSATAAAERATLWYSAQGKGTATINHVNSATDDRTFRFLIIG